MAPTLKTRFGLGDLVYLKAATEPHRGMITGIMHRTTGYVYEVSWEDTSSNNHFEMELLEKHVPDFGKKED